MSRKVVLRKHSTGVAGSGSTDLKQKPRQSSACAQAFLHWEYVATVGQSGRSSPAWRKPLLCENLLPSPAFRYVCHSKAEVVSQRVRLAVVVK
eukprot:scaffold162104_cov39-Tisochrysis_lutea.AAC.2